MPQHDTTPSHDAPSRRSPQASGAERATSDTRRVLGIVQRALLVGASNDPAEREADAIADAVLRMPEGAEPTEVAGTPRSVRRHGDDGIAGEFDPGPDFAGDLGRLSRSGGRPLDQRTRSFMEPRFGMDLSGVRVHSGGQARRLSDSIGAQAFTLGSDIVLGRGARDDGSPRARRLLAHELAHTIQQTPATARRHLQQGYVRRHRLPMQEKPLLVRRSLTKLDPKLGNKKWRLLAKLVEEYNGWRLDSTKLAKLELVGKAVGQFTSGGLLSGARTRAAKALADQVPRERQRLQTDLVHVEAKSAAANQDWITKKAEQNIKDRKDKKVGRLDLKALAQGDSGADFGAVADLFTQGRDEMKSSEELIEFGGRTAEAESNLGFMKKKGKVSIFVNVPFKGESGHDATIQKAIDRYWNVFQAEYKGAVTDGSRQVKTAKDKTIKVKVLEAPPPATGVVDLEFKVGKSSVATTSKGNDVVGASHAQMGTSQPVKERFAVKVVGEVFLFTGDHPNWQSRKHLGDGAKTRSDAGNWRMDDAGVDRMVAHEFGHLIGLDDEYSQTHSDIYNTTKKKSEKYDFAGDKPQLKAGDKTAYEKIIKAFKATDVDPAKIEDVIDAMQEVMDDDPERFAFLSAHFYEHDSADLGTAQHHLVKAVMTFASYHEPKVTQKAADLQKKADQQAANKKVAHGAMTVKQKAQSMDAKGHDFSQEAQEAKALSDRLKDLANEDWWPSDWMWFSGAGFRSGGLMGDYTTMDTGQKDKRYNAIAHDHKHPLEPRHVKRFVDMLGAARGEKWEAKHK